ncbi:MAG: hypothetical protein SO360_01875 [Bifidobacterium tsurumiense]|uniref:hypothetical protein n=1 Tax=Bifidobacterium tsurumiense TaxID=356829 RepID=UPI002A824BFD|nr:hypothetical protein [Bifidobacterium tsurumiense]MDY4677601.1 hypothetical protein [Bifidobacterium tsurumiense]
MNEKIKTITREDLAAAMKRAGNHDLWNVGLVFDNLPNDGESGGRTVSFGKTSPTRGPSVEMKRLDDGTLRIFFCNEGRDKSSGEMLPFADIPCGEIQRLVDFLISEFRINPVDAHRLNQARKETQHAMLKTHMGFFETTATCLQCGERLVDASIVNDHRIRHALYGAFGFALTKNGPEWRGDL